MSVAEATAVPKYKQSFYNFSTTSSDGSLLLYNTKTGVISFINSPEERDVVMNILKNPGNNEDACILQQLLDAGYIIESNKNEFEEIRHIQDSSLNTENIIHFTLFPTEACIFACPYCFIYPKTNQYMGNDIYDGVYKYIEKKTAGNQKTTRVEITWFGGEPLLTRNHILDFMPRLKHRESTGVIKVKSIIVTNGYLLTPTVFSELLDSGIDSFQITLDGDRETHDSLRSLKNGRPTFDIIYKNLKDIAKTMEQSRRFSISVRGNLLKSNIDSMKKLLLRFKSDFAGDERFNISFRPVLDFKTAQSTNGSILSDIYSKKESLIIQNELAFMTMKEVRGKNLSRMFRPLPTPIHKWCNASLKQSYIVIPDGTLFACDSCVSIKEESIGRITSEGEVVLNENAKRWKSPMFSDEGMEACRNCRVYPICMRGCRRERLITNKNSCHWTEEYITEAMRLYIDLYNVS